MDLESGHREYIFDWELLLNADIKLADTVIHAQFTKSYMDDTEQWTELGEKFASAQITESPSTTGSDQSNFSFKRSYSRRVEDKSSEEELDQEAKDRMDMGLPASFGMKAISPVPKKARRERNGPRVADVDFENYWKINEQVLLDGFEELSKLTPDADLGATAFAKELENNTVLLKRHRNIEYFRPLIPQSDGSAQETNIKDFIRRDILNASIAQMRNRAEMFAKKLHQFSYINGLNIGIKNKDGKFERSKTAQEILSPFESVKYELHEPVYFGKMKRKNYPLNVEDEDQDMAVMEEAPESPVKEEEVCDPKNFDFSFDPVRDVKLIAYNAFNVFGRNKSLKKYWHQRYRLFSKLNDGILMDEEGWFSVTPEAIAMHIADRMVTHSECVILDAFTGVGGNSIQFALRGAHVYAIDLDPVKLRCARQNAKVYGVEDRITFICGNFYHIAKSFSQSRPDGSPLCFDSIFLSPPWGGPEYLNRQVFELSNCTPDGFDIFETALKLSPNIAYFLPRNTSANQLMQLAGQTDSKKVEIEHNVLNNKIKALTAYYGNLVNSQVSS